jgi:hypothetical protein
MGGARRPPLSHLTLLPHSADGFIQEVSVGVENDPRTRRHAGVPKFKFPVLGLQTQHHALILSTHPLVSMSLTQQWLVG